MLCGRKRSSKSKDKIKKEVVLCLQGRHLKDCDVSGLTIEMLIHPEYIELNLSDNEIGCDGLIHLAKLLKFTNIERLLLKDNELGNRGVQFLADSLKGTRIKYVDLTGNSIDGEGALYFNTLAQQNDVTSCIHVRCGTVDRVIEQTSLCEGNKFLLTVNGSIDDKASKYINESFCHVGIRELVFTMTDFNVSDVPLFAAAFRRVHIGKLRLLHDHFLLRQEVDYIVEIFRDSYIGELSLANQHLTSINYLWLAVFLRDINVVDLNLNSTWMNCESVTLIIPALLHSRIMSLDVSKNCIKADGAKMLAYALRDTMILFIDISGNLIGNSGIMHLSEGLRGSQVIGMYLYDNEVGYEGYATIFNNIDDTNVSWLNIHDNVPALQDRAKSCRPGTIESNKLSKIAMYGERGNRVKRNVIPLAKQLRQLFSNMVQFDPTSSQYEYAIPPKKVKTKIMLEVRHYSLIIATLKYHENSKAQLYHMINEGCDWDYDFDKMSKIDTFIENMSDKFITFMQNNFLQVAARFPKTNYVDMVKQVYSFELHDIVEYFLLHRPLYYIDKRGEILHPFIYKLLEEYGLPLFQSHLEPNKKKKIIDYFERHPEIEDVYEIISLFRSSSI